VNNGAFKGIAGDGVTMDLLENFHFLRPEWFYAVIPAILLIIILRLRQGRGSSWEQTIDASLLPYLIDDVTAKPVKTLIYFILFAWILAILALAGPVWEKTPQPMHEREDALVILFDLTRSMYATDVKPNRLVRARRKLLDLLAMRSEGVTALVVYAGDAHGVSPLTDDARTIAEMIPAVSPNIMPAPGSQLAPALRLAHSLFVDASVASGRILIVTDEIRDVAEAQNVARQFRYAYPVSVLAVGTAEGAPIPGQGPRQSGFMKDANGTLVIPKVDFSALADFASVAGGRYARITLTDEDLEYLLADEPLINPDEYRELERDFDVWFEEGPWLLLLLLPLAALSFRRGWVWSVVLVCLLPIPEAEASLWDDLWESRDRQAVKAMNDGDALRAAELFQHEQWKGTAQYRGEDYVGSAEAFSAANTADGRYNLGNSLARLGKYTEAIEAYDEALVINAGHEDANFNKELVQKLLESQQQQEQQQNSDDDQNQDSDESEDQQQSSDQQDQDSENQSDSEQKQQDADEQKSNERDEAEQQQQDQREAEDQQLAEAEPLNEEEEQALQQWLRRVPDDPGGLLRRKFEMQHNDRLKRGERTQNDTSNW